MEKSIMINADGQLYMQAGLERIVELMRYITARITDFTYVTRCYESTKEFFCISQLSSYLETIIRCYNTMTDFLIFLIYATNMHYMWL